MAAAEVSTAIAFGAGLLSFASPCVLPLVPVYVAHLSGVSVAGEATSTRRSTFFHALSFVIGFSLVFVTLGASVGLAGSLLSTHISLFRKIAGVVLVILGLHVAGVLKVGLLYREKRLDYMPGTSPGYLRSFVIGSAFSIGWTPCVGPILGAIIALAWSSVDVWQGAYLLAVYSMGLGIPFLLTGLALGTVSGHLKRLSRYMKAVSIISGVLLIAVGVLIFTNKLTWLNQYFDFFNLGEGI